MFKDEWAKAWVYAKEHYPNNPTEAYTLWAENWAANKFEPAEFDSIVKELQS